MHQILKHSLAEFLGTFTLVFIGGMAGVFHGSPSSGSAGAVAVALAHGVALMVIVYVWGSISGAHVNPAVTFGLLITGKIHPLKSLGYFLAQLVGGFGAAQLILYLVGTEKIIGALTRGSLTDVDPLKTIVVEAVLTFFLVLAVYASGVFGRNGNAAGAAIGLVLTMDILAGGALTGASMNPARTFGPALVEGDITYLHLYFIGPLLGGGLAALIYNFIFLPEVQKPPVEAAK